MLKKEVVEVFYAGITASEMISQFCIEVSYVIVRLLGLIYPLMRRDD